MGKVIYSMTVSLDGYIAGPGGDIGWSAPDEELFRFHTERVRALGAHLCGRRLYETMLYWETAHEDPALPGDQLEFARIWQALPKVVFSRTLDTVTGHARLARDGLAEELSALKREHDADLEIGGAALAGELMRLGLVDEYRAFISPVVLGGGTPFLPSLEQPIALQLVETRTFGSRVVYARYRRA